MIRLNPPQSAFATALGDSGPIRPPAPYVIGLGRGRMVERSSRSISGRMTSVISRRNALTGASQLHVKRQVSHAA